MRLRNAKEYGVALLLSSKIEGRERGAEEDREWTGSKCPLPPGPAYARLTIDTVTEQQQDMPFWSSCDMYKLQGLCVFESWVID